MATKNVDGGDKLARKLDEIAQGLSKALKLKVGFLENAKYEDGTPVAMIAAIQNFGAPRAGIPPRPFFTYMVNKRSGQWPKALAFLLKKYDYDATKALDALGKAIEGQLQKSILDTNSPALKKATSDRKGFDKPLVDTHKMENSVGHEVS